MLGIEAILYLYLPSTAKEAREIGSSFYFTGKPCKRGHVCRIFTKRWNCYECMQVRDKEWKSKNHKKMREINNRATKKYSKNNRDKINKRSRDRREENIERERAKGRRNTKRWKKNNPEKAYNWTQKWKKENPDKVKEYGRKSRKKCAKTNAGKLRTMCNVTTQRLNCGKLSKSKLKLLKYTAEDFANHLLKDFPQFKTIQEAHENDYHIDHIVPVSYIAKNVKDLELAFIICMDLQNMRLIRSTENHKKHAKLDLPIVQNTVMVLSAKYDLKGLTNKYMSGNDKT